MKRNFLLLALILAAPLAWAQQQEQYSMYMMNNFMVNPAEAGTEEFADILVGYRTQWVGFDGAPRTFFLSGHTPIGKKSSRFDDVKQLPFHGAGGIVTGDQIGPFRINTVKASYAYHLPVTKDLILSLGAFVGAKQYTLDLGDVEFDDQGGDDNKFNQTQTVMTPDVSFGFWGYSSKYYFGVSAFQLLQSDVKLGDQSAPGAGADGKLDIHSWVTAGYNIKIDSNFSIIPSFVVKFVSPAPVSFDVNAKLRYKDQYWLGVSYRGGDAVVGIVGLTAKKMIDIAYAYDFTTSDIKNFSTGSHEILVGLRLANHPDAPPPAQFW